jgi:hypothetical protein|tara:strand:+ start:1643 stop:1960 length:318 start_codon:yes stop_codon:yes gene_type:complete
MGEQEASEGEDTMLVFPGLTLRITAKPNASLRTKNRIRERGSRGFVVRQMPTSVIALNNREGILLMGVDDEVPEPWIGWLPTDEINMEPWIEGGVKKKVNTEVIG